MKTNCQRHDTCFNDQLMILEEKKKLIYATNFYLNPTHNVILSNPMFLLVTLTTIYPDLDIDYSTPREYFKNKAYISVINYNYSI